jgi:hypothetical protein
MNIRRLKPSATVVAAAAALVVGLEMPAVAHQVAKKISGSDIKADTVTGKQVKESTLGRVPSARHASALPPLKWHALALKGTWENLFQNRPAAFAVDAQGVVFLRGAIDGGSPGDVVATLPRRARPTEVVELPDQIGGGAYPGFIVVQRDGEVLIEAPPGTPEGSASQFASLDGASFVPR